MFTIRKDNEEKREEFILQRDKRIPQQRYCLPYFDGNEVEIIYAEAKELRNPRENWNDWHTESVSTINSLRMTVYPLFERTMPSVLSHLQHSSTIIDIGGYNGELSMRLIAKNDKAIDRVYLFDSCAKAIEQVKKCKKCIPSYAKIEPIAKDVTDRDFGNEMHGKADVILLANMLTPGVLTKDASTCLIKKCASLLTEDGLILVSSSNIPWFSAVDYESFGYIILNRSMSLLFKIQEELSPQFSPFYILSKK